jgi:hypothetical protein
MQFHIGKWASRFEASSERIVHHSVLQGARLRISIGTIVFTEEFGDFS